MALALVASGAVLFQGWRSRGAVDFPPVKLVRSDPPRVLPEIAFFDRLGARTDLARSTGKVRVLNLWATWCPPCRREMPALDRLQAALGGADFEVIALSVDTGRGAAAAVAAFYASLGLKSLGMYVDPTGTAAERLGAAGIPTTLLIDRSGRELGRMSGPAAWDSPDVLAYVRQEVGKRP